MEVEREPMWDGNFFVGMKRFPFVYVEREPMWDGNSAFPRRCEAPIGVEREPMWDGNTVYCLWFSLSSVKLSENQCGMETFQYCRTNSLLILVEREPMWDGN